MSLKFCMWTLLSTESCMQSKMQQNTLSFNHVQGHYYLLKIVLCFTVYGRQHYMLICYLLKIAIYNNNQSKCIYFLLQQFYVAFLSHLMSSIMNTIQITVYCRYSPVAFDERVTFWLQRVQSLLCACAYDALFVRKTL